MQLNLHRRAAQSAIAGALVIAACGGGSGDDASTAGPATAVAADTAATSADSAPELVTVEFVEAVVVWAIDDEPLVMPLDYDDPIERDRFAAGLDMIVTFTSDGDVGDVTVDGGRSTFVNGERMDGNSQSRFGPESASLRTSGQSIVKTTDDGFDVRLPLGRPMSPTSLIDARDRAVDFDLDPDSEELNLFDLPPIGDNPTRLEMRVERFGQIRTQHGGSIDTDGIAVEIAVIESPADRVDAALDCAGLVDDYTVTFDAGLAAADDVLVARERRFDELVDAALDRDCPVPDFEQPVCALAQDVAAGDPATDAFLEEHLDRCPSGASLVEATVIEPIVIDGVLDLTVPRTQPGLAAYSVAASVPDWDVTDQRALSNRVELDLSHPDEESISVSFWARPMPAGLLAERVAEALEPQLGGDELVEVVAVDVAGLPAQRLIEGVGLETARPSVHAATAVELDAERLLTIDVFAASSSLAVTEQQVRDLIGCIEQSIVVAEFDPDVRPASVGECAEFGVFPPAADEPAGEPSSGSDTVALGQAAATFDGSTITLGVPAFLDSPAHIVRVAAPAWEVDDVDEGEATQSIALEGPESFDGFRATARFVSDYAQAADSAAEPLSADFVIDNDSVETIAGREIRTVISSQTLSNGGVLSIGQLLLPLDDDRLLEIRVSLGASDGAGIDVLLAAVRDSLVIE